LLIMIIRLPFFNSNESNFSPSTLRIGLVLGILLYGGFGFLDMFAMPSRHGSLWIIRSIILSLIVISYLLSFYKPFYHFRKVFLLLLMSLGQFGILIMIAISQPGDMAYFTYYAGLILIILWSSFVFMLSFYTAAYIAISTIILYNLTALFFQDYISSPKDSFEMTVLLNNNFFLASAAVLSIIGAYQLEKKEKQIRKVHNELKEEKRQLERALEKAEESDRLKSAFLANMSHEIRTPMNGILGFAELLKKPDLSEQKQQQFIGIIEKSGARMLNIINDLIDISKVEAGQMELVFSETNINKQLEFLYNFFHQEAHQKGLRLTGHNSLNGKQIIINTDKEKVYAILTNLIKNAIKFTNKGSIEFGFELIDSNLQFFVRDTGIGISPGKQKAVFERFQQVDSSTSSGYEGSGLGLTIAKAYVELLGGRIWVESEEGKGTDFYFTLPMGK